MVKGISKRVIVVKAPISSIFDEAIFILREDSPSSDMDAEKILKEACAAADEYVRSNCMEKKRVDLKKLSLFLLFSLFFVAAVIFALMLFL